MHESIYESRTQIYARELGLVGYSDVNRNHSGNHLRNYPRNYPGYSHILGVMVMDVFPTYMPDGVLGMTDLHHVWLRNDLGADRDEVLHHEFMHIRYPHVSEAGVRQITRSERLSQGKSCYLH